MRAVGDAGAALIAAPPRQHPLFRPLPQRFSALLGSERITPSDTSAPIYWRGVTVTESSRTAVSLRPQERPILPAAGPPVEVGAHRGPTAYPARTTSHAGVDRATGRKVGSGTVSLTGFVPEHGTAAGGHLSGRHRPPLQSRRRRMAAPMVMLGEKSVRAGAEPALNIGRQAPRRLRARLPRLARLRNIADKSEQLLGRQHGRSRRSNAGLDIRLARCIQIFKVCSVEGHVNDLHSAPGCI